MSQTPSESGEDAKEDFIYFGELDDKLRDGAIDLVKVAKMIEAKLDIVDKIIENETWYEGERRRRPVDPEDPVIYDKVCDIIEKNAGDIVTEAERKMKSTRKDS